MAHMADRPLKIRDVYKCNLEEAIALLPTPTAQAAKHGATPDIHANGFGSNLWDLPHLLPTPTVNGASNDGPSQWHRNSLPLPIVALQLASGTTHLPLNDGNESSDDQLLTQQMIEGCDPDSSSG